MYSYLLNMIIHETSFFMVLQRSEA